MGLKTEKEKRKKKNRKRHEILDPFEMGFVNAATTGFS